MWVMKWETMDDLYYSTAGHSLLRPTHPFLAKNKTLCVLRSLGAVTK
jgi:hypothetical protein